MTNRLEKRHKRQVARAKQHAKLSEPDVRTAEQIKAAREASRAPGSRGFRPESMYAFRDKTAPAADSGPKSDTPADESGEA